MVTLSDPLSSTPVVALHSSASTGGQWKALAAALAGRAVLTPDLPGYGRASFRHGVHEEPVSLAADAAAVLGAVDSRGSAVTQAFHLVGHSYGGAVALKIALTQPERVLSLTLIEPVIFHLLPLAGTDVDMRLYRGILGVRDRLRGAVAAGWPAHGMAAFVDFWNGPGSWDKADAEQRQRLAGQARAVLRNFTACFNESWPLWELRRLAMPLLAISGEESPAVTKCLADKIIDAAGEVTSARLFGAGHMAPLTHPAAANALIGRHVRLAEQTLAAHPQSPSFRRASAAA